MALQKFKDPKGPTVFGFDPTTQQGIAFSTPESFGKFFPVAPGEDPFKDLPAPSFDTTKLLGSPDQLLSLAPENSPVSSSTGARTEIDNLNSSIDQLIENPPEVFATDRLSQLQEESDRLINERRAELDRRSKEEVARLEKEFDAAEKSQKQRQKSEVGTTTRGLLKAGGALGAAGSHQATLINLEREHIGEQQSLMDKRQNAISQAQNAFNDKDFDLAQLQLENARKIEKDIFDRQTKFLDFTLKLKADLRQDLEFQLKESEVQFKMEQEFRDNRKRLAEFGLENNVQMPFYEFGGTVIHTITGTIITDAEMAKEFGVADDFSNVAQVEVPKDFAPGIIGEYQFYLDEQQKLGKEPVDFNTYQTLDANRKARAASAADFRREESAQLKEDSNKLASFLDSFTDKRGFVEPGRYNEAKQAWISDGYTGNDFDDRFNGYVDPSKASEYSVGFITRF